LDKVLRKILRVQWFHDFGDRQDESTGILGELSVGAFIVLGSLENCCVSDLNIYTFLLTWNPSSKIIASPTASLSAGTGAKPLAAWRAARVVEMAPSAMADRSLYSEVDAG
jgi:hypothetical protein